MMNDEETRHALSLQTEKEKAPMRSNYLYVKKRVINTPTTGYDIFVVRKNSVWNHQLTCCPKKNY